MLNSRKVVCAAMVSMFLPGLAQASDIECTQTGIKQFVVAQGTAIGNYMSRVEDKNAAKADIAAIMKQKTADGEVDDHDKEMNAVFQAEDYQPSQKLCDDLQVTMDVYADYMEEHPVK